MIQIQTLSARIEAAIRNVPDFPKAGIQFKDITPILMQPDLCRDIVAQMAENIQHLQIDKIAAIESRGFLFGMMLAQKLNVPFVLIRKEGKLPYKKVRKSYALEYGTATIEMHDDAVQAGEHILVHDDLLATGGTAKAAAELLAEQGATIAGFSFLIELDFLEGRKTLLPFSEVVDALVGC